MALQRSLVIENGRVRRLPDGDDLEARRVVLTDSATQQACLQLFTGSAVASAPAAEGRVRYDESDNRLQGSEDGDAWTNLIPDRHYVQTNGAQSTTSTTPQTATSMSPTLKGGQYVARWYAEVQSGVLAANIRARFLIDGTQRADVTFDSTLLNVWQYAFSGIVEGSLAAGAHTFEVQFARSGGLSVDSVSIRRARIEVESVD